MARARGAANADGARSRRVAGAAPPFQCRGRVWQDSKFVECRAVRVLFVRADAKRQTSRARLTQIMRAGVDDDEAASKQHKHRAHKSLACFVQLQQQSLHRNRTPLYTHANSTRYVLISTHISTTRTTLTGIELYIHDAVFYARFMFGVLQQTAASLSGFLGVRPAGKRVRLFVLWVDV